MQSPSMSAFDKVLGAPPSLVEPPAFAPAPFDILGEEAPALIAPPPMSPPQLPRATLPPMPPPTAAGQIVAVGGKFYVASQQVPSSMSGNGLRARGRQRLPPLAPNGGGEVALVWREAAQVSMQRPR